MIKIQTNVRIYSPQPRGSAGEKMTGKEYIKVLLYAYPKLDAIIGALADGAEIKALLSFRKPEDCLTIAQSIVEEIAAKERIAACKCALDEIVGSCSEAEQFLLEYKYFRRKRVLRGRFAGFCLDCSERAYFRRQNALLLKVAEGLRLRGLDEDWFLRSFSAFPCFMRAWRAVASGRERVVVKRHPPAELLFQKSSSGAGAGAFLPRMTSAAMAATETQRAQRKKICMPESPPPCGCSGRSASPDDG